MTTPRDVPPTRVLDMHRTVFLPLAAVLSLSGCGSPDGQLDATSSATVWRLRFDAQPDGDYIFVGFGRHEESGGPVVAVDGPDPGWRWLFDVERRDALLVVVDRTGAEVFAFAHGLNCFGGVLLDGPSPGDWSGGY